MKKTITIVVEGPNDDELQEAFREAVRSINEGNLSGAARNEDASYQFDVKEEA